LLEFTFPVWEYVTQNVLFESTFGRLTSEQFGDIFLQLQCYPRYFNSYCITTVSPLPFIVGVFGKAWLGLQHNAVFSPVGSHFVPEPSYPWQSGSCHASSSA